MCKEIQKNHKDVWLYLEIRDDYPDFKGIIYDCLKKYDLETRTVWRYSGLGGDHQKKLKEISPSTSIQSSPIQLFKLYFQYFTGVLSFTRTEDLGFDAIALPIITEDYIQYLEKENKGKRTDRKIA